MANTIPTVSIPGIGTSLGGSELDVQGIVDALVNVRLEPAQKRFDDNVGKIGVQVSAIGALRSALDEWQTAVLELTLDASYNTRNVEYGTSSASDFFTVTANTQADFSQYDVAVNKTAQKQKLSTNFSLASTAAIGSGTMTIALGSTTSYDIAVSATDTLSDVRDSINAVASADIKASTINTNAGTYLVIESANIGASGAFTISIADDDGLADANGLSRLQYDATYSANTTLVNSAQDAEIVIDSVITATSSSNTFDNVISGVTLSVNQAHSTGASDTFNLSLDTNSLKEKLVSFIDKYNALIDVFDRVTFINRDASGNEIEPGLEDVDESTLSAEEKAQRELDKQKGIFAFDQVVRNMIFQMRDLLGTGVDEGASGTVSLAGLGISLDKFGKLQIDGTVGEGLSELDKTLASSSRFAQLQNLLTGDDGVATQLNEKIREFEQFGGILQQKSKSLQDYEQDLVIRHTAFQEQLLSYQTQLYEQYTRLDTLSAQMTATLEYLKQQFNALNKK